MKNKKKKYGQLSESLSKEIENIVLTTGEKVATINYDFRLIYSVYVCYDQRLMKENKPLAAIFAHGDALKALGTMNEDACLVVCAYDLHSVMLKSSELVCDYVDHIKGKAA